MPNFFFYRPSFDTQTLNVSVKNLVPYPEYLFDFVLTSSDCFSLMLCHKNYMANADNPF